MAKTLLNCVNEVLKRTSIIAGDAGLLTTLTDSARQVPIDQTIQVINEGIDELYSVSEVSLPNGQAESAIVLTTGDRSYALAAGVVQLRWPMIDKTNNQTLVEYPGGYNAMLLADTAQDDTGLPHYAAISPVTGSIFLDRAPTSNENGRIYTYQYDKDTELDSAADTVPFSNAVFRAMVPVWVQLLKREMRGEFDQALYSVNLGRASRLLTQKQMRSSYSPR